jgi:hypothetical protein
MPDVGERLGERLAQYPTAMTIALQQVKRHALRRFRTDARQTAKRVD